jgi:2-dehydropantoate 2-reductase
MHQMATVAVVGLGRIGSIFAAHLIDSGENDLVCCVRGSLDHLTVEGSYGRLTVSPRCINDPKLSDRVDWVLLATKTQDTASAAPWLDRLCGPGTVVVVLQNGVEQEKRVAPLAASASILPSLVYCNARSLDRGHIRHTCPERDLLIPACRSADAFMKLFENTAISVETHPDFTTASWHKFLINVVANPLTAISGRGLEVFRDGRMERLAIKILEEATEVGRRCGADFGPDEPEKLLKWMAKYPGDTITSMLQDRRAGRPLEFEALNATVVRLGRQFGIPTPANEIITTLLESMSGRFPESTFPEIEKPGEEE